MLKYQRMFRVIETYRYVESIMRQTPPYEHALCKGPQHWYVLCVLFVNFWASKHHFFNVNELNIFKENNKQIEYMKNTVATQKWKGFTCAPCAFKHVLFMDYALTFPACIKRRIDKNNIYENGATTFMSSFQVPELYTCYYAERLIHSFSANINWVYQYPIMIIRFWQRCVSVFTAIHFKSSLLISSIEKFTTNMYFIEANTCWYVDVVINADPRCRHPWYEVGETCENTWYFVMRII